MTFVDFLLSVSVFFFNKSPYEGRVAPLHDVDVRVRVAPFKADGRENRVAPIQRLEVRVARVERLEIDRKGRQIAGYCKH